MDYLTNYYKNLCEQLQEKINLLEAGLKKAKTGTAEEKQKELARQKARRELKLGLASRAGLRAGQLQGKDVQKSGKFQLMSDTAHQSARDLLGNIEELEAETNPTSHVTPSQY
jgi:hypothetical protein